MAVSFSGDHLMKTTHIHTHALGIRKKDTYKSTHMLHSENRLCPQYAHVTFRQYTLSANWLLDLVAIA